MTSRLVAPPDCLLAVALPETLAEFEADLSSPNRDFAAGLCRQRRGSSTALVFAVDLQPSLVVLARVAADLRRLGGRVVRSLDLDGWRGIFHSAHVPRVVTLFAHGTGTAVELRSGMHPVTALAEPMVAELDTTFDLASCHSAAALADALKARAPGITANCTNRQTRLTLRLQAYATVLSRLAKRPADYMTTVVDVWTDMLRALKETDQ